MRSEEWKAIVAHNGWRQGNKFVAPKGNYLFLHIGGNTLILNDAGQCIEKESGKATNMQAVECNDLGLITHYSFGPSKSWTFVLWEDISHISIKNDYKY